MNSDFQVWKKRGHIFQPLKNMFWNQSHAQVPVVDVLDNSRLRIYYTTRDKENRSYVSFIEVSGTNPQDILYEHSEPVLELGKLGTFDDCGVMASWIQTKNSKKYLYYIGWNARNTIPYHNSIGLAISLDGGKSFEKYSEGPLWDRDIYEPYFSGTTCVLIEGSKWKMWYLSCTGWTVVNNRPEPRYHLKYAESDDGIHWVRNGQIAIDYKDKNEGGIVKASVIFENNRYKMWYSYRSLLNYRNDIENSYKIGYAESGDGIHWTRMDENIQLTVSESGWDSEMMAYPHVVDLDGRRLLFYNGNGFGQTGFGFAEFQG